MILTRNMALDKVKDPHILSLMQDEDKLHSIKALGDTPGGKVLVELLMQDVVNIVYKLQNNPGDRDALCTELQVTLALAKLIINAEDSEKVLKEQIEEALRE